MNTTSAPTPAIPESAPVSNGHHAPSGGLIPFVALAWCATWLLSLPLISSKVRGLPPEPYMFALAGLSAFGPTFAAYIVARRQGRLREVFARFRTNPMWLAIGISIPPSLHLVAKLLEVALGGNLTRWFWLPQNSAAIAALVVFPLGEEFGWRGFAHPRLVERYGPVLGPLVTGLIWGIWHLFFVIGSEGSVQLLPFVLMLVDCMLWGLIVAWLFERTQRSMAAAIFIHAGAHLDNSAQIPAGEWRLRALTLLILAGAALLAARSLKTMFQSKPKAIPSAD
jgi:membrane protease YdiL (CAAX protease family)